MQQVAYKISEIFWIGFWELIYTNSSIASPIWVQYAARVGSLTEKWDVILLLTRLTQLYFPFLLVFALKLEKPLWIWRGASSTFEELSLSPKWPLLGTFSPEMRVFRLSTPWMGQEGRLHQGLEAILLSKTCSIPRGPSHINSKYNSSCPFS